jgi:hypothetical protein
MGTLDAGRPMLDALAGRKYGSVKLRRLLRLAEEEPYTLGSTRSAPLRDFWREASQAQRQVIEVCYISLKF